MSRLGWIDRIVIRGLEAVVTACFLFLACLVVLLVVMRYVFNTTIIGGNEVTGYLFIYATALGAAASVGTNGHIRIGVFVDGLPRRVRLLADGVVLLLILALHGGLLMQSATWIASVGGFEIPIVHIPQWVVQAAIPLGCAFVILLCLTRLAALVLAFGRDGEPGGEP